MTTDLQDIPPAGTPVPGSPAGASVDVSVAPTKEDRVLLRQGPLKNLTEQDPPAAGGLKDKALALKRSF